MQVQLIPELPCDSKNYDVLVRGMIKAKNQAGLTCEIGLRRGGGTKAIFDGMDAAGIKKTHIAIDPYGNIEYHEGDRVIRCDYTNDMRDDCLANIYLYCLQHQFDFQFFNLEDYEFFARYADGVPCYNTVKTVVNEYALVHFDGPHTVEALATEIAFFHERTAPGAIFVFDDVALYNHDAIDTWLDELGWELYETSERKWAYQKGEPGPKDAA